MSIINLKNIDLNTIIKQDFKLLTIKELLNKINYNLNNIYIDRFLFIIKITFSRK